MSYTHIQQIRALSKAIHVPATTKNIIACVITAINKTTKKPLYFCSSVLSFTNSDDETVHDNMYKIV